MIAGGQNEDGTLLNIGLLYDPRTDTLEATGPLNTPRKNHSATRLQDGRVLIVGGEDREDRLSTVEIFDPATNTWTKKAALSTPRIFHSASLLADGRVLVVGGSNFDTGPMDLVEIYDPAVGTWQAGQSLKHARSDHSATVLGSGAVLVVGGLGRLGPRQSIEAEARDLATGETVVVSDLDITALGTLGFVELYDPVAAAWREGAALQTPRSAHRAVSLSDGRVMAISGLSGSLGGFGEPADIKVVHTVEIYDPAQSAWSPGGTLRFGREGHSASRLPDGRVLVVGGVDGMRFFSSVEIFDPAIGSWSEPIDLGFKSYHHSATSTDAGVLIVDGKVRVLTP